MAWISSLFSGGKGAVALIESDQVYETNFHDNTQIFEPLIMASIWQFNDVLDPVKLHSSLNRLLDIGDWRKLGGRFRRVTGSRKLQIHVPTPYTTERPAVAFSHEALSMKLGEHALADKFPKPTNRPSFHPASEELAPLVFRQDQPQTLQDLLARDEPMLSLRIVSFTDATLVSLTWPHNLMDANGVGFLVNAWSLVLAGQEDKVPAVSSVGRDVLYEAASSAAAQQEESVIANSRLSGLSMVSFARSLLWDMYWNKMESRVVHLPKEFVQKLRADTLDEVKRDQQGASGPEPWISEFDAILALWLSNLARSQSKPNSLTMCLPFDCRKRLPSIISPDDTHVENMVLNNFTLLSAEEANASVGSIAWNIRKELMRQTTPAQVLAALRTKKVQWDKGDNAAPMHTKPDSTLYITTNWAAAKHFTVAQFGPAVVKQGESGPQRGNPPGTPALYRAFTVKPAWTNRNYLITTGKDHRGDVWLHGTFTAHTWALIEKSLGVN
ncbi:unnamed protein product [Clonostachys byssicola]|uniref:Uncharacterized protein n=1 Tax=Clonostachys byssicola TaxID=160290 RepID=A0A9N9V013_9HYPO|nr:unnamed protein product [Clonostachys byssicola]